MVADSSISQYQITEKFGAGIKGVAQEAEDTELG